MLILDEVLGLVEAGVIEAEELHALFEAKGEYTSLILTGIYPAERNLAVCRRSDGDGHSI